VAGTGRRRLNSWCGEAMTQKQSNDSLERFIRKELGCRCPPAVFRDIGIEFCPPSFGNWPNGRLVSVGGRLLILILDADDCVVIERGLRAIFEAGQRTRDARGFNRFRLVVGASRPEAMAATLMPCFENLEGKDNRLHLHVVASSQVPELPVTCALNGWGR
jgi:hypothetical protein